MSENTQSRLLLDRVVNLIKKDIESIETQGVPAYDSDTAQTLVRYSGALLSITKDGDSEIEKQQRSLNKIPTDELVQMAKNIIASQEVKNA